MSKTVKEICEDFRKLVIENPTLPIKFFVGEEAYCGEWNYNEAYIVKAEIKEIVLDKEEYVDIEDLADRIYSEIEYDYEDENELNKAVNDIISKIKPEKAICVYINN